MKFKEVHFIQYAYAPGVVIAWHELSQTKNKTLRQCVLLPRNKVDPFNKPRTFCCFDDPRVTVKSLNRILSN